MKTRVSKYEPLFQRVRKGLPPSFKKYALSSQVESILREDVGNELRQDTDSFDGVFDEDFINPNKTADLRRLITKRLNEIKYKVYGKISPPKLYTFEKDIDPLDFACGFISQTHYFSNLSAIYFLGLTDQRIQTHYICKETHCAPTEDFTYDEDLAKITFRNSFRNSNRYVQYKGARIHFIEKQNLGMVGVIDIPIQKKGRDLFYIKCTNLERTFIDSMLTPQYSGGISLIILFFKKMELNVVELKKIYKKLCPAYPYWQKIGFVLDIMGEKEKSRQWKEYFKSTPLKKFFLSKDYRRDWEFNEKWKIYYSKKMI